MTAFPIDDLESDIAFEPLAETDTDPLRCTEDGCTNAIQYSGRGRKPTKCPEHKKTGSRSNSNKSAVSGKNWPKATEVKTHLDGYVKPINIALLGAASFTKNSAFLADAGVIAQQLPLVNAEIVELAKDDKDLQRILESIALPTKYAPLMIAVFGLAIPILANHHVIPNAWVQVLMADVDVTGNKGGE